MASLRRLTQLGKVLCVNKSQWIKTKNDQVMQIRNMTSDIQGFLEQTFSCTDINILSTERKCKDFVSFYSKLTVDEKGTFLHLLSDRFGVNQDNIVKVAQAVVMSQDRGEAILLTSEDRLRNALIPRYFQMFRQISRIDGGVKFLVDMRSDVLNHQTTSTSEIAVAYYRALNSALRDLISLWFSVGFLTLQRVTWESPCDLVQKVSYYEAVHPIRNLSDMKQRVGPYRRCFVFNHYSMPREPVVVLHTALTPNIASSIHSIIELPGFWPGGEADVSSQPTSPESSADLNLKEDKSQFNTAIFYSITSTQKGLQSIDLGNYLIKKVVEEIQKEFENVLQFSSLSPIPGFKDWLVTEINQVLHIRSIGEDPGNIFLSAEEQNQLKPYMDKTHSCILDTLKEFIQKNTWVTKKDIEPLFKNVLMRLCARYLYLEKRRQYALNPVANFHLGNGAVLWRINWMADMSRRGLTSSCGLMVNYRYYLENTESNSTRYLEEYHIEVSQQVLDLCSGLRPDS